MHAEQQGLGNADQLGGGGQNYGHDGDSREAGRGADLGKLGQHNAQGMFPQPPNRRGGSGRTQDAAPLFPGLNNALSPAVTERSPSGALPAELLNAAVPFITEKFALVKPNAKIPLPKPYAAELARDLFDAEFLFEENAALATESFAGFMRAQAAQNAPVRSVSAKCNIGIRTGERLLNEYYDGSYLVVIDADDEETQRIVTEIIEAYAGTPFLVKTARGAHFYLASYGYNIKTSRLNHGKYRLNGDVKGLGGYVLAPFSIVGGVSYVVFDPLIMVPPLTDEIAEEFGLTLIGRDGAIVQIPLAYQSNKEQGPDSSSGPSGQGGGDKTETQVAGEAAGVSKTDKAPVQPYPESTTAIHEEIWRRKGGGGKFDIEVPTKKQIIDCLVKEIKSSMERGRFAYRPGSRFPVRAKAIMQAYSDTEIVRRLKDERFKNLVGKIKHRYRTRSEAAFGLASVLILAGMSLTDFAHCVFASSGLLQHYLDHAGVTASRKTTGWIRRVLVSVVDDYAKCFRWLNVDRMTGIARRNWRKPEVLSAATIMLAAGTDPRFFKFAKGDTSAFKRSSVARMAVALARRAALWNKLEFHASIFELQQDSGLSRRSVIRAVRWFEENTTFFKVVRDTGLDEKGNRIEKKPNEPYRRRERNRYIIDLQALEAEWGYAAAVSLATRQVRTFDLAINYFNPKTSWRTLCFLASVGADANTPLSEFMLLSGLSKGAAAAWRKRMLKDIHSRGHTAVSFLVEASNAHTNGYGWERFAINVIKKAESLREYQSYTGEQEFDVDLWEEDKLWLVPMPENLSG